MPYVMKLYKRDPVEQIVITKWRDQYRANLYVRGDKRQPLLKLPVRIVGLTFADLLHKLERIEKQVARQPRLPGM